VKPGIAALVLAALWVGAQPPARETPAVAPGGGGATLAPAAMAALRVQVALDRAGYSPGEIDASSGANTTRAEDAYARGGGGTVPEADPLVKYRISGQDAAGPFFPDIPDDIVAQAQLPALGYRNIVEMLGERFHASPALLRHLNPHAQFAAGDEIMVPNVGDTVQPVAPPRGRQGGDAESNPASVTITVSRSGSSLTASDAAGHTLFFAPVTTGSEHDPLPIGEWKVNGVQRDPEFHYNPELFWDAEPGHSKAVLKPGPNNPVGVVWVDISKPHYGLHGTPEPSQIGKTQSHGCVRMTNWDALRVAALVRPGTRVVFVE